MQAATDDVGPGRGMHGAAEHAASSPAPTEASVDVAASSPKRDTSIDRLLDDEEPKAAAPPPPAAHLPMTLCMALLLAPRSAFLHDACAHALHNAVYVLQRDAPAGTYAPLFARVLHALHTDAAPHSAQVPGALARAAHDVLARAAPGAQDELARLVTIYAVHGAVRAQALRVLAAWVRRIGVRCGAVRAPKKPVGNVYLPLKAGRRSVVVAIVDQGTMSLLRFGEAEFARWRLAGA